MGLYVGNKRVAPVVTVREPVEDPHRCIEFQAPTAENGYTWYRKYADGWVEQGGKTANFTNTAINTAGNKPVAFPVTMANQDYFVSVSLGLDFRLGNGNASGWADRELSIQLLNSTDGMVINEYNVRAATGTSVIAIWEVKGMYATE